MRNAVTRTFTEITALIENEILPKEGVENQQETAVVLTWVSLYDMIGVLLSRVT